MDKPFITDSLNSLNLKANLTMMITIYLGIFSSISKDIALETTLMSCVVIVNAYFLAVFFKNYICIKFVLSKKKRVIFDNIGPLIDWLFHKSTLKF